MPKATPIQTSFSAGEISPLIEGRVDNERYKTALAVTQNYIPTLQGPLVRRPGTKYVGTVKDPSKPPTLIPFQFSETQSYVLEFGDQYLRFWANEGQVITNTNVFKVNGIVGINSTPFVNLTFQGTRESMNVRSANELIVGSSLVAAGSVLELATPYSYLDAANLKYAQNGDVLYITHSSYPVYILQRFGQTYWDLKTVIFQDGPLLPFNSYTTIGDSPRVKLTNSTLDKGTLTTGPSYFVYDVTYSASGTRLKLSATHASSLVTGDKVFVAGVPGATAVNNGTSSILGSYWTITVIDATHVDLVGTPISGFACTGSTGQVFPALFQMQVAPAPGGQPLWLDAQQSKCRTFALSQSGFRYWGVITSVSNPSSATFVANQNFSSAIGPADAWQMGAWTGNTGYPSACCFHQDRLVLAGAPGIPQQVDMSMNADYEHMAASGSSYQVNDNNAVSIRLLSSESNPIRWIKSSAQGLLAASASAEWQITPNTQAAALTPTNVSANQTSFYGGANIDAVQAGNATLYVQRAYRKIREMNYFFQVGTFRSTDLSELSEHITLPTVRKLAVQKEPLPLVWATRSDGVLLSMSYNRDDQTIKAGWARHVLGGQSDSGGTNPVVDSVAVITASSATFDQLWMTVKRYINGTSVVTVEAMTVPYNDGIAQEDAYFGDCGATYDAPIAVQGVTNNGSSVVTAAAHGFSNGDTVLVTDVVGLNLKTTDVDGNVSTSNLVNEQTFTITSSTVNTFYLQDFNGGYISGSSYSQYVSSGNVRKLITHISGLTWLKGETVGVLADGGNHVDAIVASSGVLTLSYPAAKVQIGYRYNSDAQTLRSEAGAAAGSSIGMLRRISRAAFLLHQVGDFSFGPDFQRLSPMQFATADVNQADTATPLFSGLQREGVEGSYDFDDLLCWRQNSMLPGMVQSVTIMLDEVDV